MAKRRTPRPPRPARGRATGGGSTRRSTSRGSRGARSSRGGTSAKPPKRRSAKTSTKAAKRPVEVRAKRAAPKTPAKRAARGRPAVGAPASALRKPTGKRPAVTRASAPKSAPPRSQARKRGPGSLREQVERDRRLIEETVPTPPSSLTLERHPSAARTGRAEFREALAAHTESSPTLTGGDVDADWKAAYSSGDEAPGGDMPTPDQGVVQDIGAALGVEYQDDEELKGAVKIEERDRHRWELDPASAEDYQERAKPDRRERRKGPAR